MTDYAEQVKNELEKINDFAHGRMKDFEKEISGMKSR